MKDLIWCGDMGGDDLWVAAVLAHMIRSKDINLQGVTTCFGNSNVKQATRNICDTLDVLGLTNIPVYEGSDKPISGLDPLLDGAYGENGLSNAKLPTSLKRQEDQDAITWMTHALKQAQTPITIVCTGPLTNIAKVFETSPELDKMSHEILWLGGSISPASGNHLPILLNNGEVKRGNITNFAEFNAINDPVAAQIIADLDHTKFTLMPLDCTQHMVVGFTQATEFLRLMRGREAIASEFLSMLDNAAELDQAKFNALGAFLHDPQLLVYLSNPELFLDAVPVKSLSFENNHRAAADFDAVVSGFNFALLAQHGEMHAVPTQKSNKLIIPGLTTFGDTDSIDEESIKTMDDMAKERFKRLGEMASLGLK